MAENPSYRKSIGRGPRGGARGWRCLAPVVAIAALLAGCEGDALSGVQDLQGRRADPFADPAAKITVALFVDSDCPVSNRYAPEVRRLHEKFSPRGVKFWLVYPDPNISTEIIDEHMRDYGYPMQALRDPEHALVRLAKAQVTPEAGIFLPDRTLVYHGRIDDRYVDLGRQRAKASRHDVDEVLESVLSGATVETSWNPAPGRALTSLSQPGVGCFIRDFK